MFKKILSGLATISLVFSGTTMTVACSQKSQKSDALRFKHNPTIPGNKKVNKLAAFHNIVYAGTKYSGLYESTDGENFKLNNSIPTNAEIDQISLFNNVYLCRHQN